MPLTLTQRAQNCLDGISPKQEVHLNWTAHTCRWPGPPPSTMWVRKSPCGDRGKCNTQLGVPDREIFDTMWGLVHSSMFPQQYSKPHKVSTTFLFGTPNGLLYYSMSPQRFFNAHIAQGGWGGVNLCDTVIGNLQNPNWATSRLQDVQWVFRGKPRVYYYWRCTGMEKITIVGYAHGSCPILRRSIRVSSFQTYDCPQG